MPNRHENSAVFPLGKPLLAMLLLGCIGSAALWLDRPKPKPDARVWVFNESHAQVLRDGAPGQSLVERYHARTGSSVGVDLVLSRALDVRLLSLFMTQSAGDEVPDLVEIEINSVGKYLRPPVQEVGFLPLNDLLKELPPGQQFLPSRLAPWTKNGVVFGVPHDVHPTALVYRKDLFDEAGVDPTTARTWADFHAIALRAQSRWTQLGHPERRAIELRKGSADQLLMMLMQRHVNLLDDDNRVYLASPKVAQTLAFYAGLIEGPNAIGGETPTAGALWTRSLASGAVCSAICADWRLADLKSFAPELAGKLRVMPMPLFDPGDAPCATWGGTMVGIPRRAKDVARSWAMLKYFYLSDDAMAARRRYTHILPPVPSAWGAPEYHQPDPYFAGQKVDELYIDLARQLPERFVTPYTVVASQQLTSVLTRAAAHARKNGPTGLEAECARLLDDAAADLRVRVQFGQFE